MDLLKYFPYPEPREIQAKALEALGNNWTNYDVFVLNGPTAFGKTGVARTLINANRSTSVITPSNLLVNQFRQEFPDTPTLARLDSYTCEEWKRPCSLVRGTKLAFCKGCPAGCDLATAKYKRGPGIYNYHTYLSQKLYREVLVVDEAHNLLPVIRERFNLTIWQHDAKYPSNVWRPEQILKWAESLPANKQQTKKIAILIDSLKSRMPSYTVERTKDWFNGKGTKRGDPEERDCLKLSPVDIRGAPPVFWPKDVSKIVLLSATISRKDIEALGLSRKRVLYINCESPIPARSRPIIPLSVTTVNRHNLEEATADIARYINNDLAPKHAGQKGIVHATYQMAGLLRQYLTDPRYMFHDRLSKREVYKLFRESDPREGRVLVACGMYEGVDLPEDAGRWQVIAKVPWPNLGNSAVKYQADNDPEWYVWETLKITMQACGRICRTPQDFGVTYILDLSFDRLVRQGIDGKLIPKWYLDGIAGGESE